MAHCASVTPKDPASRHSTIVSYVRQVADALQYAHEKKLIYRDIKPENMLVGENFQVLLSDFGIALVAQSTRYQNTQEVIGTATYMAPEQLQGKPRRASDQYSLGIVVYEWICGDRPFHGSFTEIYSQHMFAPPPPLHEKVPEIAAAVEEVVLTALAKDPQQRFTNIQAFANALEHAYQSAQDIPIVSQNQTLPPSTQHIEPTAPASSSIQQLQPGGIAWFALSHSAFNSTPKPTSHVNLAPVRTSAPSPTPTSPPQGTTLYTYRGHVRKIRDLAWSPNGKRIASASDDYTAQVWDASTGNNPIIYRGHSSFVEGVAWSPDGKRIASGSADATVQIWEPSTGNLIYTYRGHSLWVNRISWSPDGKYIVSGEQSGSAGSIVQVRVWEAATGKTIVIYRGHTNGVFAVAWSPDGTRIASDGYDGTLQVWDATSGNPISIYRDTNFHYGLSWSSDSNRIVVGGSDTQARVLDANTGNIVYTYNIGSKGIPDVDWSPDGARIAVGSTNGAVYLVNAANGNNLYTYNRQAGSIEALGWSPDSKLIASGNDIGSSTGGTVQVWQAI